MTQIRHFDVELAELKRSLVSMGNLAEEILELGLQAILTPVIEAREQARLLEHRLDELDSAIEERCHQLLALQSPMARDMRFLIAATRITSDLERIGDLGESVAKRSRYIARHSPVRSPPQLEPLGRLARQMVHHAMDAFVTGRIDLARQVLTEEDQADSLTKQSYQAIQGFMVEDTAAIKEYTHLLRAVGHFEHAADIAVSIAEEAVFIQRGTLIRHAHEGLEA